MKHHKTRRASKKSLISKKKILNPKSQAKSNFKNT